MEPLTIGALVASALGLAGEAALKGTVGEAAKDAYAALKSKIAAWANSDVKALETTPTSAPRQAVLAEAIDGRPVAEQEEARDLAKQLIAALKSAPDRPIGLDIGLLDALDVDLGSISATRGTGIRINEVRSRNSFKVDSTHVGDATGKRKR
jgi:hypothetical protein